MTSRMRGTSVKGTGELMRRGAAYEEGGKFVKAEEGKSDLAESCKEGAMLHVPRGLASLGLLADGCGLSETG